MNGPKSTIEPVFIEGLTLLFEGEEVRFHGGQSVTGLVEIINQQPVVKLEHRWSPQGMGLILHIGRIPAFLRALRAAPKPVGLKSKGRPARGRGREGCALRDPSIG
jgi:hypothetical protein